MWILPTTSNWRKSAGPGGNAIVGVDFDREPPLLLSPQLVGFWF